VLFGIDVWAKVLPWEYDEPPPEDRLFTRQYFLERIPVISLLHLSAFKDYLLYWAERSYQELEDDELIGEYLTDLTKGGYVTSQLWKQLMCLCGPEQSCHLLLSAGLEYVVDASDLCEIFDTIDGLNQKYARLQLWFAEDLDLAIASRSIPPQVKNSDEAKLIVRQGPMDTNCEQRQLRCLQNSTHLMNRSMVHKSC
jgi:hypothetical protein